ncbi:hypothetical protein CRM22_009052 [Opisthorchis felineus]|uniref:Uncharacterized protein n=1 Tax=Opisthorchis felineus TaxID=147828 RepID=A0A4S2LGJ6_OPIFE|nr:hypothetical protein CRM22_009052 [Opisthorchis felineus]
MCGTVRILLVPRKQFCAFIESLPPGAIASLELFVEGGDWSSRGTRNDCLESSSGSTLSAPTWLKLAELQNAKGNWDLNANLAKLFEIQLKQLRSLQPVSWPAPATTKMASTVWATALSLAYLSLRAMDAANEWSLLANKARSWLVDQAREFEKDPTIIKQLCEQLQTLAENVIKME